MGRILQTFAALVVGTLVVSGCGKKDEAPPAPPPPAVTVSHPIRQEIIEWDEYNGRLAAVEQVEVRARVSGFVESVNFLEGTLVNKGDPLYVIDPAPFKAAYDQAAAEQQRTQAQLDYDTAELKRVEELRATGAISTKEYEDVRLAQRRSGAALAGAQAALQAADLNLQYTKVTAPIPGRIGRQLVTQGNLINGGAGQSTLLTTIVSLNPIYCYADADERSVLKYQRLAREQKRASARDAKIPCWLGLADEQGFPRQGVIDFVNNQLDPTTGTITARGVFDNKDASLTPGLFARLRIPGSGRYQALLIPDTAVQTDQNQKFVYVVDEMKKAKYRHIELGTRYEGMRVILGGLTETDQVVVNGFARLRPDVTVNPTIVAMPHQPIRTGAGSPATQMLPTTRILSGLDSPQHLSTQPVTQPATTPPATTQPAPTQPARTSGPEDPLPLGERDSAEVAL